MGEEEDIGYYLLVLVVIKRWRGHFSQLDSRHSKLIELSREC